MLKPKLTNFADFIEKPKPVIVKSAFEKHQEYTFYLNMMFLMLICLGCSLLYLRYKHKEARKQETKETLLKFDNYINEFIVNEVIENQK